MKDPNKKAKVKLTLTYEQWDLVMQAVADQRERYVDGEQTTPRKYVASRLEQAFRKIYKAVHVDGPENAAAQELVRKYLT